MASLHVRGPLRRVGNVWAVYIPVTKARAAGLAEGQTVDVEIRVPEHEAFGLLRDRPYREFRRAEQGLWRDRV